KRERMNVNTGCTRPDERKMFSYGGSVIGNVLVLWGRFPRIRFFALCHVDVFVVFYVERKVLDRRSAGTPSNLPFGAIRAVGWSSSVVELGLTILPLAPLGAL